MGLFDTIHCKYQLPKPSFELDSWNIDLNKLEFQTKDLENIMMEYTIRENGELWYDDKTYKWVDDDNRFLKGYMEVESSEEKPANFHGVLLFYCYEDLGERDGKFYNLQLDYEAKFVDNKIVELKLVEEKLEDVTEYKLKMKEFFKQEEIKRNK